MNIELSASNSVQRWRMNPHNHNVHCPNLLKSEEMECLYVSATAEFELLHTFIVLFLFVFITGI